VADADGINHRRAVGGFLLSPLVAPVAFWLVTTVDVLVEEPVKWVSDFAFALPFVIATGAPWAYASTVVFAVPTYIVCVRLDRLRRRHMMAAGVLAGALTLPLALGPAVWTVAVGAIMGSSSATVFWLLLESGRSGKVRSRASGRPLE
jgi:hypothetical protein